MKQIIQDLEILINNIPTDIPNDIPQGDMPGDPVIIGKEVTQKANVLFPYLIKPLQDLFEKQDKVVVAIAGGSGVGKTCIASLFTYYFNINGIKAYTLSGDNYPRRIPEYNDAERLHIYRASATKALATSDMYNDETKKVLKHLQSTIDESDPALEKDYPFLIDYHNGGKLGLKGYLGSTHEINFDEISDVLKSFKQGESQIALKRMGRDETSIYYDTLDFTDTKVIFVEWTHGLNSELKNVDLRILLNSTPEETLQNRLARNRDQGADSPFVQMVLAIEQRLLHSQAINADIIMSKDNSIINYATYKEIMKELDE